MDGTNFILRIYKEQESNLILPEHDDDDDDDDDTIFSMLSQYDFSLPRGKKYASISPNFISIAVAISFLMVTTCVYVQVHIYI